jgi:hypothetical protein
LWNKGRVYGTALAFGALGLLSTLLQFFAKGNTILTHIVLNLLATFWLYAAAAVLMDAQQPKLVLRDEGLEVSPIRWPLRPRRPPRLIRWEDIDECRFLRGRMSGRLHIHRKPLEDLSERHHGSLRPQLAARVPLSYLDVSGERLAHEMQDRAGRLGVQLRWTRASRSTF